MQLVHTEEVASHPACRAGEAVRSFSHGQSGPTLKSLDAQGSPEQHDGRPQIANSRFGGLCGSGATPSEPQDPSPPHGLAVRGSPTLLQPMGAKDTVLVIDHRCRIVIAWQPPNR
jgi:hypothetical protein